MIEQFGLIATRSDVVKTGDKFYRLTVLAIGREPSKPRIYAVCECVCGVRKKVRADGLTSGLVTSCGCAHSEAVTTHGKTSSAHYGRWRHMMDRCYRLLDAAYPHYGGRGIKVCDEWHDVTKFIEALPAGYYPGAELDRIDNDKGYEHETQ